MSITGKLPVWNKGDLTAPKIENVFYKDGVYVWQSLTMSMWRCHVNMNTQSQFCLTHIRQFFNIDWPFLQIICLRISKLCPVFCCILQDRQALPAIPIPSLLHFIGWFDSWIPPSTIQGRWDASKHRPWTLLYCIVDKGLTYILPSKVEWRVECKQTPTVHPPLL